MTLFSLGTLTAQAPVPLRDLASKPCNKCIHLDTVAVVGDATDRNRVITGRGVVRNSSGDLLHARVTEIAVFDSTGSLVRVIGREGSGPGEFRRISLIALAGDSLIVWDNGNGRVTLFDREYRQVRSAPTFGRHMETARLANGDFVLNLHLPTTESIGLPYHIVSMPSLSRAKSFGLRPGEAYDAGARWSGWRELSTGVAGTFWTAPRAEYRIEQWDADGRLLRAFERKLRWFPANIRAAPLDPEHPPAPTIEGIYWANGLLWVFISVPDPQWRHAIEIQRTSSLRVLYQPTHYSGLYDTVVEVIDLEKAAVIASQSFDTYLWGSLGDGFLLGDAETRNGPPRFIVLRATLAER